MTIGGMTPIIVLAMLYSAPAPSQELWPDTPLARLAAMASLQTLNADLLSHDSATLTLDRWCARHKLAPHAKIVADRVPGALSDPPADVRAELQASDGARIAYRRVKLRCGERILSEADNWYVPSRLTEDMNRALETTDMAFGRVVQPLGFHRRTIAATLLWSPLPDGWDIGLVPLPEANARAVLDVPEKLIEHRALLIRSDGKPFSYVVETYTGGVLDFPPSARPAL